MAITLSISSVLHSMLVLIYILNLDASGLLIQHNNITIDEKAQERSRVKRVPLYDLLYHLKIRIRYESGEEIDMNWMKAKPYVANENLPIIIHNAQLNLNDIGDFAAYYDVEHCSSVVYFENQNAFYGIIGTDYYVDNLPFDFDVNGNYRVHSVGAPYIKKRPLEFDHIKPHISISPPSVTDLWEDYRNPSYIPPNDTTTHYQNISPSASTASDNIYYLESLVFVTQGIVELFKNSYGQNDYLEWIVKYYIVYFHAVDMMFKKIQSPYGTIYINIAKIIIEDTSGQLNFCSKNICEFKTISRKLSSYLYSHEKYYPEDSFDHVFIHSRRDIRHNLHWLNGISRYGADLTNARRIKRHHRAVPFTLIKYKNIYADYILTVHEIGRIFDLNIDWRKQELTQCELCYDIMRRSGPACNGCLEWSERSISRLTVFLKSNNNRCFLLNQPRSLRTPGPNRLISPRQICNCYGYDSYITDVLGTERTSIPEFYCHRSLVCEYIVNKFIQWHRVVRPFDGIPCGNESKVCWNSLCT